VELARHRADCARPDFRLGAALTDSSSFNVTSPHLWPFLTLADIPNVFGVVLNWRKGSDRRLDEVHEIALGL